MTHACKIVSGQGFRELAALLSGEPEIFVVYDKNVSWVAQEVVSALAVKGMMALEVSEEAKTMDTVLALERQLLEAGLSRGALLLAIGGGITTDLVGFAASLYKRGIRYANIPTTLLAQVDAAIGGKTGVNLDHYKNMLGAFRMPEFTFLCPLALETLPEREFRCGLAELLKTFLIGDASAYADAIAAFSSTKQASLVHEGAETGVSSTKQAQTVLEVAQNGVSSTKTPSLVHEVAENNLSSTNMAHLVLRAAEIKADIVRQDPEEHGIRATLNLGHTFGHAIEHEAQLRGQDIRHGEAVAMGIVLVAELSEQLGVAQNGLTAQLKADFQALGLPTECPYPSAQLKAAMARDKKATGGGKVKFVLLRAPGDVILQELSV